MSTRQRGAAVVAGVLAPLLLAALTASFYFPRPHHPDASTATAAAADVAAEYFGQQGYSVTYLHVVKITKEPDGYWLALVKVKVDDGSPKFLARVVLAPNYAFRAESVQALR